MAIDLKTKIVECISLLAFDYLKDKAWGRMIHAADGKDPEGDLSKVLRRVGVWLQRQEEVLPEWKDALEAATRFVVAENIVGHDGQHLFEKTVRVRFVEMEKWIVKFIETGREPVDQIIAELDELAFDTANLVAEHGWCHCGTPLLKQGWKRCQRCYHRGSGNGGATTPVVKRVKKPGSAARRSDGPRPASTVRKPFKKGHKNK